VRAGEADVVLAGGTESPISPLVLAGLGRTHELCDLTDAPDRASRPFDHEHCGIVPSEGACFLVVESAKTAARRGAQVYAEIVTSASSCDAQGMFGANPIAPSGSRALVDMLKRAHIGPTEIDYVCAHANSSPYFDRKEILILKEAFGEYSSSVQVSSIKAVLGHPFGASGAFQVAAAALALKNQIVPPTHNLEIPAPECDLDCVPLNSRHANLRYALVTSYGYGGVNAFLLLRKC
jgi:3-oxoacyl-[acyl-carrier-protein] synthase II